MKSVIFRKTERKLISTSIGIVFCSLFLFAMIVIIFYRANLYNAVDQQIEREIRMLIQDNFSESLTENTADTDLPFSSNSFGAFTPSFISPQTILLIYENNALVYQSANRYFDDGDDPVIEEDSQEEIFNYTYGEYVFRGASVKAGDLLIVVLYNVNSELTSMQRLMYVIGISLSILIVLSIFLSIYLARKALAPVEKAYREQVRFVQDASHEMRTPLAIMKGKIELLAVHDTDTIEQHSDLISQLMSEVYGLERLNKDLLLLTKEDIDTSIAETDFSIHVLYEELNEFYGMLAESQQKEFSMELEKDFNVHEDYQKLKQAVVVLIENSFRYTDEGDNICIRFYAEEKNWHISVTDSGIGMKKSDQEKIYERFYRSDEARARDAEGSGIGLSVLKSLSKTLGFKISLHSEYGKGSEFVLTFHRK